MSNSKDIFEVDSIWISFGRLHGQIMEANAVSPRARQFVPANRIESLEAERDGLRARLDDQLKSRLKHESEALARWARKALKLNPGEGTYSNGFKDAIHMAFQEADALRDLHAKENEKSS